MCKIDKHAYLIIAHKADYVFKRLIELIDDPRNDIYIHMDVKNQNYNENDTCALVHYSQVYHTKRTNVTWGGYSQINSEMILLKAATKRKYQYYHLISGQDLPIKSQDYIHDFFNRNDGYEFIRYERREFSWSERVRYYYPLQERIGKGGKGKIVYQAVQKIYVILQKAVGTHRNADLKFQKGTNWFSITDAFARYAVDNQEKIAKIYKDSFCCDEVFMQTLAANSIYGNKFYGGEIGENLRLIDWTRGKPYIWRSSDIDEIRNSDKIFARKFDSNVDCNIIDSIVKMCKSR